MSKGPSFRHRSVMALPAACLGSVFLHLPRRPKLASPELRFLGFGTKASLSQGLRASAGPSAAGHRLSWGGCWWPLKPLLSLRWMFLSLLCLGQPPSAWKTKHQTKTVCLFVCLFVFPVLAILSALIPFHPFLHSPASSVLAAFESCF